jgi:hypothetical protein
MAAKQRPGTQAVLRAVILLGRWQRVSSGHVVFGGGCSCGAPTTSMKIQDYEQDILAFLQARHGVRARTIVELLKGNVADPVLADLERSIDSFESLHRGGRAS